MKNNLSTTPCISPFKAISAIIPAFLAVTVFGLIPALLNVGISFTDYKGSFNIPFKFVGFDNYKDFFTLSGEEALSSFIITIKFALSTVFIQQFIAIITALLVNQKLKSSNFFRAVFFLPNILGVIVIGFMWNMMLDPYAGPAAKLLELFGRKSAFLGDPDIALWLVVMVTIWSCFGFAMAIYLAGLQTISQDYYEAAAIDGASKFRQAINITLPLLRPAITINFWISISGTLGMFDIMFVLTQGGPGNATRTFSLYFFQQVQKLATNQGQVAAMSIYFFIFITVVMLSFNYFFRRKEVEL